MNTTPTIRNISPPHPGMDYERLRREGIERIIALGSDLWTDFNVHDPGITLLEVLCYAITDLSYRANLPLEDLLAERSGKEPAPGMPLAGEVLSCNPVTLLDWRKLLIDLEGVKNAWVCKDEAAEPKFGIAAHKISFHNLNSQNILKINGLLRVLIDLDDALSLPGNVGQKERVLAAVRERLHAYRNLCEDFSEVDVVKPFEVHLCAALEIDEDGNPHTIMAELLYRVQEFLTPMPRFFALEEMLLRRGTRSLEEVFEGPLLQNGFMDTDDLAASELRRRIQVSDLYQIMKALPGVQKVWGVKVKKAGNKDWDESTLGVDIDHKPVLDLANAQIELRRRGQQVFLNAEEVRNVLERLRWKNRPLSARERLDIGYPAATARPDLGDYFSIQNDIPHAFHVDHYGLEASAPAWRHAQVRQLKAFLLVFDQLLANYLAHLTQVKNLLSADQSRNGQTLFAKPLYEEVPDIGLVLIGFGDGKSEMYDNFLQEGLETPDEALRRRKALMDHLLARFGEFFTDYALTAFFDDPRTGWTTEDYAIRMECTLAEMAALLKQAPRLSRERGKGFNYRQNKADGSPDIWHTANVEGLKRRVCLLLGLSQVGRDTITCPPAYTIEHRKTGKKYDFFLKKTAENQRITLLQSTPQTTEKRIREAAKILMDALSQVENYAILDHTVLKDLGDETPLAKELHTINKVLSANADFTLEPAQQDTFRLGMLDSNRKIIAHSYASLKTAGELKKLLRELKTVAFNEDCEPAGFHIVEHILLRPRYKDCCSDGHPAVALTRVGVNLPPVPDPYSFWITVAASRDWKLFRNSANRRVFEQNLRMETPAHIGVRICWISNEDMYRFEIAYGRLLTELNHPTPDRCNLDEYARDLTEVLNTFETVVCCAEETESTSLICK